MGFLEGNIGPWPNLRGIPALSALTGFVRGEHVPGSREGGGLNPALGAAAPLAGAVEVANPGVAGARGSRKDPEVGTQDGKLEEKQALGAVRPSAQPGSANG